MSSQLKNKFYAGITFDSDEINHLSIQEIKRLPNRSIEEAL